MSKATTRTLYQIIPDHRSPNVSANVCIKTWISVAHRNYRLYTEYLDLVFLKTKTRSHTHLPELLIARYPMKMIRHNSHGRINTRQTYRGATVMYQETVNHAHSAGCMTRLLLHCRSRNNTRTISQKSWMVLESWMEFLRGWVSLGKQYTTHGYTFETSLLFKTDNV